MSFECSVSDFEHRLASLQVGADAVVVRVMAGEDGRAERLAALGVTPGAAVRLLQRFPGFVFQCDETELAVEPAVAHTILVRLR
jgi:Fe2+ transport system protein FeoA